MNPPRRLGRVPRCVPHAWIGFALAGFALAACSSGAPQRSPRREALDSLIDTVFLPMLADFEHDSTRLARETDAFCDDPTPDGLQRVRARWDAARGSWERTEVLGFGPHTAPPWRLASQIDFWPARPEEIDEVLAGDIDLAQPDALDGVGAAAKGLPVLEYLLFADADVFERFETGQDAQRRCRYLRALGADLSGKAEALRSAWDEEFAPALTLQGGPERFESINEAFGEVVNSLAFTVEVARDEKLGRPLGLKNGGEPRPETVASRFSDRSLEDVQDNLRGVASVFGGRYHEQAGAGVASVLGAERTARQAAFELHVARAHEAIEAIDEPLREAVVDDRRQVEKAIDELRELLIFLQVDLTQSLSVTVTFGGADGD